MSHTLRVLCVLAAAGAVRPRWRRRLAPLAVAPWSPLLAAVAALLLTARHRWRQARSVRADAADAAAEVVVLGELVALGLSAGMPFVAALRRAAEELTSPLRDEVDGVVRLIGRDGSHVALETAGGHARRLYVLAGRAMLTGAPILEAVEMFVDESRAAERARRQAAVRRLPVTLVFPLALLILPGFVIVVLAPALIGSLQRFAP